MAVKKFLALIFLPLAFSITCYRGIDIQLPGANFNQKMSSIGCRNADYCLRSFGIINGQNGSFASCVTRANFNTTCKIYPTCLQTKNSNSDFLTCCCKTDLCNDDNFVGETSSTTTSKISTTTSNPATTNSAFLFITIIFGFFIFI